MKKLICNKVAKYQPASLRKKTLSHILLYVLCLYFLRMHHDYFFRRGFESVRAHFISGNIGGKWMCFIDGWVIFVLPTQYISKCDFNEVAKQLRHGCSPVNLLHIFRTPFPKTSSGGLLLLIALLPSVLLSDKFKPCKWLYRFDTNLQFWLLRSVQITGEQIASTKAYLCPVQNLIKTTLTPLA